MSPSWVRSVERDTAFDLDTLAGQQVGENAFGVVLRERARLGVGGVILRPGELTGEVNVDRLVRESNGQLRRRGTCRECLLGYADVVENLQGPRLDDEGTGGGRRLRCPIDDPRHDAVACQFVGEQ